HQRRSGCSSPRAPPLASATPLDSPQPTRSQTAQAAPSCKAPHGPIHSAALRLARATEPNAGTADLLAIFINDAIRRFGVGACVLAGSIALTGSAAALPFVLRPPRPQQSS